MNTFIYSEIAIKLAREDAIQNITSCTVHELQYNGCFKLTRKKKGIYFHKLILINNSLHGRMLRWNCLGLDMEYKCLINEEIHLIKCWGDELKSSRCGNLETELI